MTTIVPAKNYPKVYCTYLQNLQNVTPNFGNMLVNKSLQQVAQGMTVPCIIDSDIPFNQENKYMLSLATLPTDILENRLCFYWKCRLSTTDNPAVYIRFKDAPIIAAGNPVPIYSKIELPNYLILPNDFVGGKDYYVTATYTLQKIDNYTYEAVGVVNPMVTDTLDVSDDTTVVLFIVNIDPMWLVNTLLTPRYPMLRGDSNTTISVSSDLQNITYTPQPTGYITARNYIKPRFEPYFITAELTTAFSYLDNEVLRGYPKNTVLRGYPKNTVLYNSSGTVKYISVVDNNATPIDEVNGLNETNIAKWVLETKYPIYHEFGSISPTDNGIRSVAVPLDDGTWSVTVNFILYGSNESGTAIALSFLGLGKLLTEYAVFCIATGKRADSFAYVSIGNSEDELRSFIRLTKIGTSSPDYYTGTLVARFESASKIPFDLLLRDGQDE